MKTTDNHEFCKSPTCGDHTDHFIGEGRCETILDNKGLIDSGFPIGYIQSVSIKFNDGSEYIVRGYKKGDTIYGGFAHKIMYKISDVEREYNSSSVFQFTMGDKIRWILNNSETLQS
jgi:hypothetical protein